MVCIYLAVISILVTHLGVTHRRGIPANKRAPPLEGGNFTNIGGIGTLKHEIRSQKFYELLINTELKGDTSMYLDNFYNHIKMCINAMIRLL